MRTPERVIARPLSVPNWTGHLQRTDAITGHLTCSLTGWKLALTGTSGGRGVVYLTARFDSPIMADDAPPWTDEFEIAETQASKGYDCFWTGSIIASGTDWTGDIGDRHGGRMTLTGKSQREGVIALRAVAHSRSDA